jgi:hypothetical protein
MHSHACKLLVSFSLLALGGCDLKRELVGETLPDVASSGSDTGDATHGDPTDGVALTTTAGPTTGAPDGAPCELGPIEVWEEGNPPEPGAPPDYHAGPVVTPGPACAGEVCLYGVADKPTLCDADAGCVGDDRLAGTCSEPFCEVDPAWAEAHTTCTRRCEVDTDCPAVPGCTEGPVCAAVSKLGSLCCQKVCGCRDGLEQGFLQDIAADCSNLGDDCQ